MKLRVVPPDEALNVVLQQWNLVRDGKSPARPIEAVVAEYFRSFLAEHSPSDGDTSRPVYITALLRRLHRHLHPLLPRLTPDSGAAAPAAVEDTASSALHRDVLEQLEILGDVQHVGGGFWLGTPVRLIRLSADDALLVGCITTAMAEQILQCPVTVMGAARRVAVRDLRSSRGVSYQPRRRWLGLSRPLMPWYDELVRTARANLARCSSSLTEFQVYDPQAATDIQALRWRSPGQLENLPESLALCRSREGAFSTWRYWLGTLEQMGDRVRAAWEYTPQGLFLRRLQYALDLVTGNPTHIDLRSRVGSLEMSTRNPLPAEEQRLLLAIGVETTSDETRFPKTWHLPLRYRDVLRKHLQELGILIREQ